MFRLQTCLQASALGLIVAINLFGGCSPSSPSSTLNLTGTWSGTLGPPMSGTSLRLVWTATQNGLAVSGPVTVSKPNEIPEFPGTLSGTLSGLSSFLSFTVPAGSVPGFATCAITGNGSVTAAATTISGNLNVTYSSCTGFVQSSGSQLLSLTKL